MILAVTVAANLQHHLADHVEPPLFAFVVLGGIPLTERNRRKGKVAAAAGNRVELEFKRLEALLEFADDVFAGHFHGLGFIKPQLHVLLDGRLFALQNIRQQHLVEFGKGKAAELLSGGHKRDVADHLQSRKHRLGLGVLHVGHLKAALQDVADIEEAAVDAAQNHVAQVMNVNVAALDQLLFLAGQIELLVERLREVALDERTLGRHKRAVEVGVLAIAQTQHIVGVLTQLLEGLGVGLLVVTVFGVGVGHFLVLQESQNRDHHFVQLGHGDMVAMLHAAIHLIGNLIQMIGVNHLVAAKRRLLDGALDLFGIEAFDRIVFLYYFQHLAQGPRSGSYNE